MHCFSYIVHKFQLESVYTKERERDTPVALGGSPFIASDPVPSLTGVKDEYNPLRPNDYEDMMKKRRERERDEDDRKRDSRDSRDYRDSRDNRDRDDRLCNNYSKSHDSNFYLKWKGIRK